MLYSAPISKHLLMSGFIALPLLSRQFYDLSAGFSIFFCLIAAYEIIHMAWSYFHPSKAWK